MYNFASVYIVLKIKKPMNTLVIIPSRLSATRLPGKPLLKINGLSIISHVFKNAQEANIGEVIVATEDQEIVDDVKQNGGQVILTKNTHNTGTDRIYEALQKIDNSNIDLVMNLQGDEPLMNVEDIRNLHNQMIKNESGLGTLASIISKKRLLKDQNIVKVMTKKNLNINNFPEAINFMRKVDEQNENIYHHLGIYCYKKEVQSYVQNKEHNSCLQSHCSSLDISCHMWFLRNRCKGTS